MWVKVVGVRKNFEIDEVDTLETEGLEGLEEKIPISTAEREKRRTFTKKSKDKEGLDV